jgi:hypothetical protein
MILTKKGIRKCSKCGAARTSKWRFLEDELVCTSCYCRDYNVNRPKRKRLSKKQIEEAKMAEEANAEEERYRQAVALSDELDRKQKEEYQRKVKEIGNRNKAANDFVISTEGYL